MLRFVLLFAMIGCSAGKTNVEDSADQGDSGDSGSGSTFEDGDGDGFASSVDCDDADAAVHPGADEVWYDGVDQDCDGADDDQDGDGYARADDCDDEDPAAFPGAGEVPDDGVDQDCDGQDTTLDGVDPDDVDDDGYRYDVDCDDHDADVHPGADEVWYDGVDQDCDGADDDQDGDGYPQDDDCDDTDAAINPGSDEILSDGVDQDCDGLDAWSLADLDVRDLVISEIMNNPSRANDDYGEWFELYNATEHPVELEGLVVTAALSAQSFTVEGSLLIEPGAYVVMVRDGDSAVNGGVPWDYDYPSDFSLANDAETLQIGTGSMTLDEVPYDQDNFFPDDAGFSMTLHSGALDAASNDEGQYWCDASSTYGDGDAGTPGDANDACADRGDGDGDGWVAAWDCDDGSASAYPGAAETARDGEDSDCDGADGLSTSLKSGDLLIVEIMQNPLAVSDDDGEWFEVYVSSAYSWNLNGLLVSSSSGETFTVDEDLIVSTKSYLVFAENDDPAVNGGVTIVDWDYPGTAFGLGNGSDDIYLYNGATLVDSVAWDNGATFPDPSGASMILKSSAFSASGNNSGSNWCTSTSTIGGVSGADLGTPGATNDSC